jgi:solute carrier family 10 (sodium/bile acid cotransporter), member 7
MFVLNNNWLRSNGFLLGLAAAVGVALLFPEPGARDGFLHAEFLANAGIVVILLLQGLSLPLEQVKAGARNWRLHLLIQLYTFGVFPIVGIMLDFFMPRLWSAEPEAIRNGFLFLCVLPSTISTSVVLTTTARGNTIGALFNAVLSNILGVFITPVLVHLLMKKTGQSAPFGPLLLKITFLTLVPFLAGMLLRHPLLRWIEAHRKWVPRISSAIILFIVYSAFCDSVAEKIWQRNGLGMTARVLLFVVVLFTGMSLLIQWNCRMLKFNREDGITAYFCSVKKTLSMGVPLAMLIFGGDANLSLILLPIMFYHPVQLLVNGFLANQWAQKAATPAEG